MAEKTGKNTEPKTGEPLENSEKEKTIEQIFVELDQVLEQLESPETSLEESFACYEAGMKLVKEGTEKIDKVEKKIIILQGGDTEDGNE